MRQDESARRSLPRVGCVNRRTEKVAMCLESDAQMEGPSVQRTILHGNCRGATLHPAVQVTVYARRASGQ